MLKPVLAALALTGAVAAAPALAGGAPAAARPEAVKLLKVALPDGRVGLVRYTGEVPPQVVLVPVRQVADPFAAFEAMFADMDRQMDAMMRQAAALAARTPAVDPRRVTMAGAAPGAALPANTISRSFVSFSNGGKVCSRSTLVTAGPDGKPQVRESQEGDCEGLAAPAAPNTPAKPAAAPAAPAIDLRDTI
ncbi:hypothetical protein E2493_20195 [Sphingomonas parva]|uniref:Uncharacterized protein n=1 Tax=Sphingomonas parva TaxID=2555898 RepID=A0A4Y8ZKG9_9SPHN|nr:hypothetical protein [Sphingomonas parva]TFI56434.1 hypothetical protein E2493_20195 [Sphingomonas parva]